MFLKKKKRVAGVSFSVASRRISIDDWPHRNVPVVETEAGSTSLMPRMEDSSKNRARVVAESQSALASAATSKILSASCSVKSVPLPVVSTWREMDRSEVAEPSIPMLPVDPSQGTNAGAASSGTAASAGQDGWHASGDTPQLGPPGT